MSGPPSRTPAVGAAEIGSLFDRIRPYIKPAKVHTKSLTGSRRFADVPALESLFEQAREPLATAMARGDFIDIWAVSGVRRREVRNAAVLAWLLSPRGTHGQGVACLKAFMGRVARDDATWELEESLLRKASVQAEQRPLGSDRDRVDIVITGRGFVVFVEVKIDAGEGYQQLSRYTESAAAKAAVIADSHGNTPRSLVVYLSPLPPNEPTVGLVKLDWTEVADALVEASAEAEAAARFIVRSYAKHIRAFSKGL